MDKNKIQRRRLNKIIVGGLRETIRAHGPITKLLIGSAAKRIMGTIIAKEEKKDDERTNPGRS